MKTYKKKISSLTQVDKEIKSLSKRTGVPQSSLRNRTRVTGDSVLYIEYPEYLMKKRRAK